MSESRDPSSIILRDFKIRPLALAGRRLASLVSLKLQIATKDAKIQKPMELFPDSEDVVWTTKGGVKVSCAADVTLSVTSEDKGVITEICSVALTCVEMARPLRQHSMNEYQLLLKDGISSTQMITIFTTMFSPPQGVTTSKQGPAGQLPKHYSYRKSVELNRLYECIRDESQESRAYALHAEAGRCFALLKDAYNSTNLDKAIPLLDKAVQYSSILEPSKSTYLMDLSHALLVRYEHTDDLTALNRAVSASQDAWLIMGESNTSKERLSDIYASSLFMRYKKLGDIEDLQLAISQYEKVIELMAEPESDIMSFGNLATALIARFERLLDLQDIDMAIFQLQKALHLVPDENPYRSGILQNLGYAFKVRFDRLGNLDGLEQAISYLQIAVEHISDDNQYKPTWLDNLGNAFQARFDRLGNLDDLEAAVCHKQKAVELTPDGYFNKLVVLNSLAMALQARFDYLGNLEDLEAAIYQKQMAVKHTPINHLDKPSMLDSLGLSFQARFRRLGNPQDLEAAIHHQQMAFDLTPDGHPSKLVRLNNLGVALVTQFDNLGRLSDLEVAIRHHQMAVLLIPDGHPDRPKYLLNLADGLDARFERFKRPDDLEVSISCRWLTVELTPEGHSDVPNGLVLLARTLLRKFIHLKDIRDLEEAITNLQRALKLLSDTHSYKSAALADLGTALYCRYQELKQPGDLQGAYKCSSSVATLVSATPRERLKEAKQWASRSFDLGLSSLPAYQVAIDMLPRVAWLGLPIHGQHALLNQVGDVVRDAVGAAIGEGEYEMAVEWIEAGRSIAWQNFLNLRTPLDELRSVHPQLATQLQSTSQQLDIVGHSRDQVGDQKQAELKNIRAISRSLTQLGLDWERTVEEIRTKPGFEYFLKARSFSQLSRVARDGPVVILNVQERGCAALLLIPKESGRVHTREIPLPDLSFELSLGLHLILKEVLRVGHVRDRDERDREDRKIHRIEDKLLDGVNLELVLALLWKRVVRPVIDALAYQPRTTNLPRIWWCATGSLAFLPIHAAGIYDAEHEEPGHKLSDYAVSSYTPTLSALLDDSIPNSEDVSLLAVAQANAPGASRIPNTEVEVERIKEVAGEMVVTSLTKGDATIERVLEGMEKNNWVHLACHGQQNVEQPMKSGLLLHNGRLELEKLISKSLPNADFAFLSACQTATGDDKIAEESVHLAAGMIFSGYKGVVATMWSINDSIAPQIAEDVYRYMLGNGKPDRKKAAHALHYAVKKLREENKAGVLDWAPFIHIGR